MKRNRIKILIGFEVLTVVVMKSSIFRDIKAHRGSSETWHDFQRITGCYKPDNITLKNINSLLF
jgi:hypothetical protein